MRRPELEEEARDLAPADALDEEPLNRLFQSRFGTVPGRCSMPTNPRRVKGTLPIIRAGAVLTEPDPSDATGHYLNLTAIQQAMRSSTELRDLAGDPDAVVAIAAHQFQQRIYASPGRHDGKIGEGTLDALGFVRHRDDSLIRQMRKMANSM